MHRSFLFTVAESGLSASLTSNLRLFKRNILLAGTRRFISRATPATNAAVFDQILARCPRAVGIRPDGSLVLHHRRPIPGDDPLQILADALHLAKRELGRQVLKSALATLVTLLIAALRLYIGIRFQLAHPAAKARTAQLTSVLIIAAILLIIRTLFLFTRRHRILAVLSDITKSGDLNPERLARAVAPTSSRALLAATGAPAPLPDVRAYVILFTILALCLMCFPFVGLFTSLLALLLTLRKKHWTRKAAITALIVSTLATAYIIILLTLARK